jgi:hypothetical protein
VGGTWLFDAPVRQVAAGVRHTAAVNDEGVLFIWGNIAGGSLQGAGFSPDADSLLGFGRESVLFIGTQFSILYTFMYSPA